MNEISFNALLQKQIEGKFKGKTKLRCRTALHYKENAEREYARLLFSYVRIVKDVLKLYFPEIKTAYFAEVGGAVQYREDDIIKVNRGVNTAKIKLVPGFYKTETDLWTFISEKRGILIPVRDPNGLIPGLQIWCDDVQRRKFRWVSSAEKKDGCRAEGWMHFVGEMSSMVILTEGPMKTDVIHALSGLTVLAVPGVNTLTQLKIALDVLQERGLKKVMTAFDMDFSLNKNVQMYLITCYRCSMIWDSNMALIFGTRDTKAWMIISGCRKINSEERSS